MIKRFNQYIKEEYRQDTFKDSNGSVYRVYELLFYAFDWDDNILRMPTEIILLNKNGEEVGMSTEDFAKYRDIIGKKEFDYNGQTITGYANDSFRYFRDETDPKIFVKDVKKAINEKRFAKSYNDFIECLTTGALFAIITARGHETDPIDNSSPMREGIEYIISMLEPKQKESMIDHLKMYAHLFDESIGSDDELIKNYLNICEYIGVSAPSRGGKPENPEKSKEDAFFAFVKKCNDFAKILEDKFNKDPETIKKGEKWKVVAKIGFSDDDSKNVKHIDDVVKELKNETFSNVKEFFIKDTGKEEVETNIYTKYEESNVLSFKHFETQSNFGGGAGDPMSASIVPFTNFNTTVQGEVSGNFLPGGSENRQDAFGDRLRKQTKFLTKTSKEIFKNRKKKD